MKKKLKFKHFTVVILLIASFFAFKHAYANIAENCTFTGNSSDYCNASDGHHNLRVINCKPGSTDCGYDPPPPQQ